MYNSFWTVVLSRRQYLTIAAGTDQHVAVRRQGSKEAPLAVSAIRRSWEMNHVW